MIDRTLKVLKVAIAVVLLGASSAWTAGVLAVANVDERVTMHVKAAEETHEALKREFITQAADARTSAAKAADESAYARIMVETLLRMNNVPIPARPKSAASDGNKDGGR